MLITDPGVRTMIAAFRRPILVVPPGSVINIV